MTLVNLEHEAPPATSDIYPNRSCTNLSWQIIYVSDQKMYKMYRRTSVRKIRARHHDSQIEGLPKTFEHHLTMVFRRSSGSRNQAPVCQDAQSTRAAKLKNFESGICVRRKIDFCSQTKRKKPRPAWKQTVCCLVPTNLKLVDTVRSS